MQVEVVVVVPTHLIQLEVLEVVDVRPGIMENAAPLSARKRTPVEWSWRKTNGPGWMALMPLRDTSFSAMSSCSSLSVHLIRFERSMTRDVDADAFMAAKYGPSCLPRAMT